jgi:hypothetical protein
MAQDVSARLGIFGEPLMAFVGRKLGYGPAVAIAALLSIGCLAWALELMAAVGRGVEVLGGGLRSAGSPSSWLPPCSRSSSGYSTTRE